VISAKAGHALDPFLVKLYRIVPGKKPINPNVVTILGFLCALGSTVLVASGYPFWAGTFLFVSGFFDLMDGALARSYERVTKFGGFLDSVLDRYSDLAVMAGLSVYFFRRSDMPYVLLTLIASVGVAVIPYTKARAEAASIPCNTGLLERPERTIIILIGMFFNLLKPAVVVLSLLTHVTVIQRILLVKRKASQ
jgi:CDP-diacylglycerol---glycerol-3-phosphate 3-phosphatidyltransferase